MTRIVFLSEIPTPYRVPFFERLAARADLDVTVLYCARSEPDRPWQFGERVGDFSHEFLPGTALPIRTRRNTFVYEINPTIVSRLRALQPDLLIIGGYAVFAEQAAILYATAAGLPWLIHSESHLLRRRATGVRTAKNLIVGAALRRAAGGLAVGTAAAQYLAHYGIPPSLIRIVPNTIDVSGYADAARAARADAEDVRAKRSLPDRFHLFVGRLVADKGIEDLIAARASRDLPPLVVAGEGPLRGVLERETDTIVLGFQDSGRLIELYALAETTVVPSRVEPWGVVVNEALACGSPVVTTDAVGAAIDLIRNSQDGLIVPAGDALALGAALERRLDPHEPGTGPIGRWTYDLAVEQFTDLVRALAL
jgi:glycosyltransferase involved in cell wall biosynthesis